MDKVDLLLTRRVAEIFPSKAALAKVLQSGKKIRLYLGIDPTGIRLHLGHAIALRKIQEFADLGHEVILLFGTGTVLVGDPSQRATARTAITEKEIAGNIKDWKTQAAKIVDFSKVTIKQNADWLLKLNLKEIVNIASKISAVQLFKRDSFTRRLAAGNTVWYHETLYPLLQGYDSVAMDVDLEVGGTDQTFNMLIGRELMQKLKNKEKFVLTVPMIVGTDGRQMSKSSGNCVWLNDSPEEIYKKLMAMPDEVMPSYFENLTDLDFDRVQAEEGSALKTKKRLAFEIVKMLHNVQAAEKAGRFFQEAIQENKAGEIIPDTLPWHGRTLTARESLTDAGLAESNSEAFRIITQGGFYLNNEPVTDPKQALTFQKGDILRRGRKEIRRIV